MTGRKYPNTLARIIARSIFVECYVPGINGKCWVWTGYRTKKNYGQITVRVKGAPRGLYVHRVAWKLIKKKLRKGLTLDHLCFNEPCWNPDHLEPVTFSENTKRARARERHLSRISHEYYPQQIADRTISRSPMRDL